MSGIAKYCLGLLVAVLGINMNPGAQPGQFDFFPSARAQESGNSVRPEVGKPLQAARELIRAQRAKEALAKIREAEGVADRTANENFLINQMRFSAASAAGETEVAAKSLEAIMASGRVPAGEQARLVEAMTGGYIRAREYSKAIQWASRFLRDNGGNAQIRQLLAQAYYLNNDFARAAAELQAMVNADSQAGRTPSETNLQLLASCYDKLRDNAGYTAVFERLVANYPKKEYWASVLSRVQRKPGYASRLDIDYFRLKLATGNLRTAADYMEMVQLALQAGSALEAKKIVDQAFAAGVLGTGAEADRHKRLRDLAAKSAAESQAVLAAAGNADGKDGLGLLNLGFDYVSAGRYDKGLQVMEQGMRRGGLKYPEDAKLHLGVAYFMGGQKARAIEVFRGVHGRDGAADLARLWAMHATRAAN